MKVYTTREIIRILKDNGYVIISTSGSHDIWRNESNGKQFPLPSGHKADINRMMWQRIVRENGINCNF